MSDKSQGQEHLDLHAGSELSISTLVASVLLERTAFQGPAALCGRVEKEPRSVSDDTDRQQSSRALLLGKANLPDLEWGSLLSGPGPSSQACSVLLWAGAEGPRQVLPPPSST